MQIKTPEYEQILNQVLELPNDWHAAGTFDTRTLQAMYEHCLACDIRHSLETGSGRSTLLFSHISPDHKVFALDGGTGSIRHVRESALLRSEAVEFIEGPTQLTLPQYRFSCKFDVVLLDGPHGYPFPDLEYYYVYPQLAQGGLLIIDDINIPTVHNLFRFLATDDMFSLIDVVGNTAFFKRTDAPCFSGIQDGWWAQNYNRDLTVELPATERLPLPWTHFAALKQEQAGKAVVDRIKQGGESLSAGSQRIYSANSASEITVEGWAVEDESPKLPDIIYLRLDEETNCRHYEFAARRRYRGDVASALQNAKFRYAGYVAALPAQNVKPGTYTLALLQVTQNSIVCSLTGATLRVS
jgi:hypothetical protein